jgi:hypothetical protein
VVNPDAGLIWPNLVPEDRGSLAHRGFRGFDEGGSPTAFQKIRPLCIACAVPVKV